MDKLINVIVSAIVAAVVVMVFGVFTQAPTPQTQPDPTPGAVTGPDVYARTFFHDNAIVGGFDFATSSLGAATYTAASFVNAKVIEQQASGALTVTLPTNALLSAAGYLPNIGDTQITYIHASTTKITLATGTGITLSSASTTKDISANSTGKLECTRLGATEARLIQCLLTAD